MKWIDTPKAVWLAEHYWIHDCSTASSKQQAICARMSKLEMDKVFLASGCTFSLLGKGKKKIKKKLKIII